MIAAAPNVVRFDKRTKMPGIGTGQHPASIARLTPGLWARVNAARRAGVTDDKQCERTRNGVRCCAYRMKGSKFCYRHGGSKCGKRKNNGEFLHCNDMRKLRFYGKSAGPKLKAILEERLSEPEQHRLRLDEELELMRETANEAVALYSQAFELPDTHPKKSELLQKASFILQASLDSVRTMTKTAAEVATLSRQMFPAEALKDVTQQIVKMIHVCFGDNEAGLQAFDKLLNEELRLPAIGNQNAGTDLTPDVTADVLKMDSTIPFADEESEDESTGGEAIGTEDGETLVECPTCNTPLQFPPGCVAGNCPTCNTLVELE